MAQTLSLDTGNNVGPEEAKALAEARPLLSRDRAVWLIGPPAFFLRIHHFFSALLLGVVLGVVFDAKL